MKISLRKISKYFVRFIILLVLVYILFSLYLQYLAQDHIKKLIAHSLKREVQFSRIVYRFPLEFQLYDVVIDDFLSMNVMNIRFSKDFLVKKNINLAKVSFIKPTLNLKTFVNKKASSEEINNLAQIPEQMAQIVEEQPSSPQEIQKPILKNEREEQLKYNIKIKSLVISEGHLVYPFEFSGKEVLLNIDQLSIKGQNFSYPPIKEKSHVEFQGRLAQLAESFPESQVEGKGWVDIVSKDMDGIISLKSQKQGELLDAHIIAKDNDVSVDGEINSKDFIKKNKNSEDQPTIEDIAVKALSFLGVDIGIKFRFETKLDDFKISNVSFTGRVGKPAVEQNQEIIQSK